MRAFYLFLIFFLFGIYPIVLDIRAQSNKKVVERNGKLAATYSLNNNKIYGDFIQYYPNGLMQCQGFNSPKEKHGEQYWYFPNDKLWKTVEYSISFPDNWNFTNYTFKETNTEFWENGKNKSVRRFLNGIEQHECTYWYENGNLMRNFELEADKKHYSYQEFYQNGKQKIQRHFILDGVNLLQDGLYQEWNEKGILIRDGVLVKNVSNGYTHTWSDEGQLLDERLYENNVIVAQKVLSKEGKTIISYDKRDPANNITYVAFHPDMKSIQVISYFKTYKIEDSIVRIDFNEHFDIKGKLYSKSANYHRTVISGLFNNYLSNKSLFVFFKNDSVMVEGVKNNLFEATLKRNRSDKTYSIRLIGNPAYNGRFFNDIISFPVTYSQSKIEKKVDKDLKEKEKKFTNIKNTNYEYLIDKESFKLIKPYYISSINKLFFDSVQIYGNFRPNSSGAFQIKFLNSSVRYEGQFKEGLLDSICTLYLNDSIKLSEIQYQYGLQHGSAEEWFPNGNQASNAKYRYNKKVEETLYFINGGKKKYIVYGTTERPIKQTEWHDNGKLKSEIDVANVGGWKEYELTNEWYNNGTLKKFQIYEDSVLKVGEISEDGQIIGYSYSDFTKGIFISKKKVSGREYMDVKLPDSIKGDFTFSFNKDGYQVNGSVSRQQTNSGWKLTDVLGEKVKPDYSQLSFPESLPCFCQDWTEHSFSREPLKNYVDSSSFFKYQFNFHKPLNILKDIYGNPFYNGNVPEKFIFGKKYEFYSTFVLRKELVIDFSDSKELLFSIAPCISKYAFSSIYVSGEIRYGFPKETDLSITEFKTLGLTFSSKFLRQVDEKNIPILDDHRGDTPGVILFNAKKIKYNSSKEFDFVEPSFLCSRAMELTGTKIIIEINDMLPDLSLTYNYPLMMDEWVNKKSIFPDRSRLLKIPESIIEKFRGLYLISSTFRVPLQNKSMSEYYAFTGRNVVVGKDFIAGTLNIHAKKIASTEYLISGKLKINEKAILESLNSLGLKNCQLQYNPEDSELYIHFYYESK